MCSSLIIAMFFLLGDILFSLYMSVGIKNYLVVTQSVYSSYESLFVSLFFYLLPIILILNFILLWEKYMTATESYWFMLMFVLLLLAYGIIFILPIGDSLYPYIITTASTKQFLDIVATFTLFIVFLSFYRDDFFSWKNIPSTRIIHICEKLLTYSLTTKRIFLKGLYIFVPFYLILFVGMNFYRYIFQKIVVTYPLTDVFFVFGFSLLFVFLLFVLMPYASFTLFLVHNLLYPYRMDLIDEKQLPNQIREWISIEPHELKIVEPEYIVAVKSAVRKISTMFGIKYLPNPQQFNTVVVSPKSDYHLLKIFFTPQKIVMSGLYVNSSSIDELPQEIKNLTTINLFQIFKPSSGDSQNIPRIVSFEDMNIRSEKPELLKAIYEDKLNILTPFNLIDSLEEFNIFISTEYVVARSVAAKNAENIFLIHQIMKFVLELIAPHLKKSG